MVEKKKRVHESLIYLSYLPSEYQEKPPPPQRYVGPTARYTRSPSHCYALISNLYCYQSEPTLVTRLRYQLVSLHSLYIIIPPPQSRCYYISLCVCVNVQCVSLMTFHAIL